MMEIISGCAAGNGATGHRQLLSVFSMTGRNYIFNCISFALFIYNILIVLDFSTKLNEHTEQHRLHFQAIPIKIIGSSSVEIDKQILKFDFYIVLPTLK
jgi:hypothetical protein